MTGCAPVGAASTPARGCCRRGQLQRAARDPVSSDTGRSTPSAGTTTGGFRSSACRTRSGNAVPSRRSGAAPSGAGRQVGADQAVDVLDEAAAGRVLFAGHGDRTEGTRQRARRRRHRFGGDEVTAGHVEAARHGREDPHAPGPAGACTAAGTSARAGAASGLAVVMHRRHAPPSCAVVRAAWRAGSRGPAACGVLRGPSKRPGHQANPFNNRADGHARPGSPAPDDSTSIPKASRAAIRASTAGPLRPTSTGKCCLNALSSRVCCAKQGRWPRSRRGYKVRRLSFRRHAGTQSRPLPALPAGPRG